VKPMEGRLARLWRKQERKSIKYDMKGLSCCDFEVERKRQLGVGQGGSFLRQ